MLKMNPIAETLEVPGIRVFANRVAEYEDGVNLTIGQPDFPTPENIKEAGMAAIRENRTGYSHNAGLPQLRSSVSNFFMETYGFKYTAEDEIIVTNGASEGLDSVLRTILEHGDEVILPSPSYSGYEALIRLNGGVPVHLDISGTNFKPEASEIQKLITERTKAIIFNHPSNPTGVSLSHEETADITTMLAQESIFVISDEIYSENTFTGKHVSFGAFDALRGRLFIIHGLSKSHAMTGWRLGFVLGPADFMKYVLRVHLNNSICASLPSQHAAIEALDNTRSFPGEMNERYIKRRDFIHKKLNDMGLECETPTGAFYIFPSVERTGLDDLTFAERLLAEEHVAVVPGSTFSKEGRNHIRISYASSMENLEEGMRRMERFLERHRKSQV
ncbi:aminotransferase class I/II-fold pyridoxal phosphate-dependent enzyme [Salinicoccus sp. RF5]|uniref:aminotransferase class I/II-fold pyridoxal phosphate-dependent enzyme n=1 Tax=Salinicoccus sp. RF5 TaxID=2748874 RepID=UPI001E5DB4AB|nr:aminotransferase class I/II-fold pyridoxal phosphate-dependent enzyme [Salinicoccus sp. RF5]MCC4723034.1 aminotransferase class I/II-fold pyridoxal phosphate-dependent enzyme [Salinicoccus sp. RF5]